MKSKIKCSKSLISSLPGFAKMKENKCIEFSQTDISLK